MKPLFTLILEDNTAFIGGTSYLTTRWKEIPKNKKIKRVFYSLPLGNYLCLDSYDKYYHMIEGVNDLNGSHRGQLIPQCAYIMGKREEQIDCYKINLITKTQTELIKYNSDDEFIKKLNKDGWK